MNREIKFRAWDNLENRMYENVQFGIYQDPDEIISFGDILSLARFEIMQYTGLKDKNGKEIYEGHILHKDSHWGWYVAFEDGAFCRIPINIIQRINLEHYRMKQKDVEDWEIIGNIHEGEVQK